jgi:hypothetical protein
MHLALANLLDRTVIVDVNVQPFRLEVHRLHAIGLEDAVLLGEIVLRKGLSHISSQRLPCPKLTSRVQETRLTSSSCCSPIFLPMSLLIQSSPEEPPSLDIMPGTTRGILSICVVVAKARVSR